MKKIVMILVCLVLSACETEGHIVEGAVSRCKEHNGVSELQTFGGNNMVICLDGTLHSIRLDTSGIQ